MQRYLGQPLTVRQIHEQIPEITFETLRKRINRMVDDADLTRIGGDRSKGYTYVLTPNAMDNVILPENFFR